MGLEEEAVFFLLQRATSEHRIRSAFTHGTVGGFIYVEGFLLYIFMNSKIQKTKNKITFLWLYFYNGYVNVF